MIMSIAIGLLTFINRFLNKPRQDKQENTRKKSITIVTLTLTEPETTPQQKQKYEDKTKDTYQRHSEFPNLVYSMRTFVSTHTTHLHRSYHTHLLTNMDTAGERHLPQFHSRVGRAATEYFN